MTGSSEAPGDIRPAVMDNKPRDLGTLLNAIAHGMPIPSGDFDAEESGRRYVQARKREMRERTLRSFFGELMFETDWAHPDLKHNSEEISRIRGWQYCPLGILASGDTGTGKTRAMAALCWRLHVDEAIDMAFWRSQELFARIGQFEEFGKDYATEFIEALAQRPVLVIDDLGQEATSRNNEARIQQWFFALMDRRYVLKKPCLITTNHTAKSLRESASRPIAADPLIRRLMLVAEPIPFAPLPLPERPRK